MDDVEDFFNSTVRYTPAEWKRKASAVGTFDTSKRPGALKRWDTDANAGIDLSQVPTSLSTVAWFWRCPEGHRWREPLFSVSKRGVWKRFDISSAACRRCVLIAHAPRCPAGHLVDRVDHLNEPIASHLCRQCDPDALDARRDSQAKARAAEKMTRELERTATDRRHVAMTGRDLEALIAFERRVRARRARGVRWWKPVPPKKIVWDAPLGTIAPSRREAWTGKDERSLIAACVDAGLPVRTGVTVTVPDVYYPTGATWQATPDILIGDSLVIEVDHPAELYGGPTHEEGFPAADLQRDDAYRAAGLTVIRVRLGGLMPVTDSINFTRSGYTLAVAAAVIACARQILDGTDPGSLTSVTVID